MKIHEKNEEEATPPELPSSDQDMNLNNGAIHQNRVFENDFDAGNKDDLFNSQVFSFGNIDFVRGSHNRVKLYVLCDQRVWDDRGTGHVACMSSPDNSDKWYIIVRLESNEKNVLESIVQQDTLYQKQQGTLIVWSESETCDLALSFQEKNGCTEIWDKICKIQGKDPSVEDEADMEDQEPSDSSTSGMSNNACASALSMPQCNLQNLSDFETMLSNHMLSAAQREKMATSIQKNSYISKLCDLFQLCEDLENNDALGQLATISKNLFLLNNNALLSEIIEEKNFRDVVGMLEYDSSFNKPKRHREFLWEKSKFREILPISSDELKAKIHQTYRLQYVLDVCLPAPSLFEENLLTVLSSHLFFNRAEIVNLLLNEKELVKQLFQELKDSSIDPRRQRDLTNFLKELCAFAHSLQPSGPQGREQFFKIMYQNDVLDIIDPCISSSLPSMRAVTVELLTIIVDFNPQIFREHLTKQFRLIPESKNDSLLINKLINHMLNDRDPEFTGAGQMSQVLRILLDPEGIGKTTDKLEFIPMFYKRAFHSFLKPLTDNAFDDKPLRDDYYMANRMTLVIDLLCFFVEHHSFNMRNQVIGKNLLGIVLVYLKSVHHFLAHCALKFVRKIIGLKDEVYVRNICEKKVIDLIVDCFVSNGNRYNLLNSALIEFFEFIRCEEIRLLMEYTLNNFWDDVFSKALYVPTFKEMKFRYEKICEFNSNKGGTNSRKEDDIPLSPSNAQWKKEKEHDEDELFFSKDDDELPATPPQQRKSGVEPFFPAPNRKRRNNDEESIASIFGGNITPPSTSGTTRSSRITIKMASRSSSIDDLEAVSKNLNGSDLKTKRLTLNIEHDAEESVVSSTSSSPSKSTEDIPEIEESIFGNENGSSSFISKQLHIEEQKKSTVSNPVLLKCLSPRLVDYEVDSDDDEEDEKIEKKKEGSTSPPVLSPIDDHELPTSTDEF